MFKKLKSLFIVEDEADAGQSNAPKADKVQEKSTSSVKTTPKSAKSNAGSKPSGGSISNASKGSTGKPNEKFINRLLGALEEHNIEGFDYLEYKQALQNLGNVAMDEPTKFKSALAMAKTMGATPKGLKDSASHYIKVLTNEEAKFLEAFKSQQSRQVSARNTEIQELEKGIAQREARIKELQKEIEAGKKSLEAKKTSINQANAKVQSTKEDFYYAYNIVAKQISDDLAKMNKYLN